ncbi:MAG: zinc ABC transporter substrate-binding protein [Chloroflexi bacterium]|nr:zinc ABC transporter substrate-binding protein [Chloroflexota bacterium]
MTGSMVLAVMLLLMPAACAPAAPMAVDKIGVMVTVLPQVEFVTAVGGGKVEVTAMVPPGANPHTYEVTPAQMAKLSTAKVYFKVGSPIEFELTWLDKLTAQNEDMKVVDCNKGSNKGIEWMQSSDPDEPGIDPHTWTSPQNVKIMVNNICAGLVQLDTVNKSYYEANRDSYLQKLEALDSDIKLALAGAVNRTFIVYHPAWGYFAREYGLQQLGIEKEGKEPQAAYMARLINEAREKNIRVIFVSPQFDTRSAEAIAHEIGGRVVSIDPEGRDYLDNMRKVAAAFGEALK